MMKTRALAAATVLAGLILGGCGLRDAIDIQVFEKTESEHWLGDGTKQCQPKVKVLNNTGYRLASLALSVFWQDANGDERETVVHMDFPLESDQATPSVPLLRLFGSCDQVKAVRLGNVVSCQLADLPEQDCINRLNLVPFDTDL